MRNKYSAKAREGEKGEGLLLDILRIERTRG